MIKSSIKESKKLLLLCSAVILGFASYFVVCNKPFLVSNDQWFQYNVFYNEWLKLIRDTFSGKGLPMYSWNMFFGSDFYSSMGYYCVGDIFLPILLCFEKAETGLIIETILCIYISAILMRAFLKDLDIRDKNALLLIPFLYAFAGETIYFLGNYMFHRFYAFLPLLFIGIHKYFNNKKPLVFIIAVTILFLQNFYLMYPTCLFIFLYCAFELWKNDVNIKDAFLIAVKTIFYFVVGFMCSAIVLVPALLYIIQNPRVGEGFATTFFANKETLEGIFSNLVAYNPFSFTSTLFVNGDYTWHDIGYNLTIGIVPLTYFISYIVDKNNSKDRYLFIVLILVIAIKPFSSIMHGFSVPSYRWLFLFEFFILICCAKQIDRHSFKKEYGYAYLFVLLSMVLLLYVYRNNDIESCLEQYILLCISLIISTIILFASIKKEKIAIILSIVYIIINSFYMVYRLSTGASYIEESINQQYLDYLVDIDEDLMYRYSYNPLDINPGAFVNLNKSLECEIMSTNTYSSTYDPNLAKFIYSGVNDADDWIILINNPYACTAAGTKYYIVFDERELPDGLNYEYYIDLDYLKIYKNMDFRGFAYTMDKLDYFDNLNNDLTKYKDCLLVDSRNVDISKYNYPSYNKMNIYEYSNNYLKGNILCITVPNNEGWKVYVNGKLQSTISVYGGFMGLELESGYNDIEMYFVTPGLKIGVLLSVSGVLATIVIVVFHRKKEGE